MKRESFKIREGNGEILFHELYIESGRRKFALWLTVPMTDDLLQFSNAYLASSNPEYFIIGTDFFFDEIPCLTNVFAKGKEFKGLHLFEINPTSFELRLFNDDKNKSCCLILLSKSSVFHIAERLDSTHKKIADDQKWL